MFSKPKPLTFGRSYNARLLCSRTRTVSTISTANFDTWTIAAFFIVLCIFGYYYYFLREPPNLAAPQVQPQPQAEVFPQADAHPLQPETFSQADALSQASNEQLLADNFEDMFVVQLGNIPPAGWFFLLIVLALIFYYWNRGEAKTEPKPRARGFTVE